MINETRKVTPMLLFILGRSHHTVIRVYDEAGNVIEAHEHGGTPKNGSNSSASLIAAVGGEAVHLLVVAENYS